MTHNFGKEKGSLFDIFGGMTYDTRNNLKNADKASIRVAKRKHQVLSTGARHNRKKRIFTPRQGQAYVLGGGGEELPGEACIPGGVDLESDEESN